MEQFEYRMSKHLLASAERLMAYKADRRLSADLVALSPQEIAQSRV
jgi:hypothetical protein